jgi:hypothetical protein
MPCPDAHYTLSVINHKTGEQLKVELMDLPFPGTRSFDSHLPLLTLRASSMSHRFPRAPFVFASIASGPEGSPGEQDDGGKTASWLLGQTLTKIKRDRDCFCSRQNGPR